MALGQLTPEEPAEDREGQGENKHWEAGLWGDTNALATNKFKGKKGKGGGEGWAKGGKATGHGGGNASSKDVDTGDGNKKEPSCHECGVKLNAPGSHYARD